MNSGELGTGLRSSQCEPHHDATCLQHHSHHWPPIWVTRSKQAQNEELLDTGAGKIDLFRKTKKKLLHAFQSISITTKKQNCLFSTTSPLCSSEPSSCTWGESQLAFKGNPAALKRTNIKHKRILTTGAAFEKQIPLPRRPIGGLHAPTCRPYVSVLSRLFKTRRPSAVFVCCRVLCALLKRAVVCEILKG